MNKILLIILLIALYACHGSKNDFSVRYKYVGMNIENAQNLSTFPYPTSLDSVPASAYAIRVNLQTEILATGNANADPDHPIENLNHIQSINVTSNNDFDLNFPAGSSLNERFICFNGSYFTASSLSNLYLQTTSNEDYIENDVTNKFDLLLISPPTISSIHTFTVQLTFYDGTIFIDSTAQIKLY